MASEVIISILMALNLKTAVQEGRPDYVSAASGIVERGNKVYVIADDENAIFYADPEAKFLDHRSFDFKPLPLDKEERKKLKSDFESLIYFDEKTFPPHGALLAWPSLSNPARQKAVIIPLNEKGEPKAEKIVDASEFTKNLKKREEHINIEGVSLVQDLVYLFQRGDEKKAKSGYFAVRYNEFVAGLKEGKWPARIDFTEIKIPDLNGVKVTLAEGQQTSLGILGLATAEASKKQLAKGEIGGTLLVRIKDGKADVLDQLLFGDPKKEFKLEGMIVREHEDEVELILVDDADDASNPSHFYRAVLKKEEFK